MKRYYIKELSSCSSCPFYCDEGEFCKHPDRTQLTVVQSDTFENDCPLVSTSDLYTGEITVDSEIKEELTNILSKFYKVN